MVEINTNITLYGPQSPYHYTADNIPLEELLENDKALANALNGFLKGNLRAPVDRDNFTELQPYLGRAKIGSNEFQSVFVRPGKFMARVNSPAECKTGAWEDIPGASGVDAIKNLASQNDSRDVSGAGRTAVVEFRESIAGGDQFAIIEPWDAADWDTNPGAIARIDLVYVRAYPAVDQNGNSIATAPDIGILKGAGILTGTNTKSNQTDRFTNALQTKAHMAADSSDDNIYGIDAGDSESAITSTGSIPSPEDFINSSEVSINNAEALTNRNYMFLPVGYIVVPATYASTTDTIADTYLSDIRPFLRTTELTLDERQAVLFASPRPHISNPFATVEYVKDAVKGIVIPPGPPGKPGAPGAGANTDIVILGQGVIRGGADYGPESIFPSAKAMWGTWDGKPDWDDLPTKYQWNVVRTKATTPVPGVEGAEKYIWEHDYNIRSKKTISLTLPKPNYTNYFVECEYMYSVPLMDIDTVSQPVASKLGYNFDVGLSVVYDTNKFTIVTTGRSWYGNGWRPDQRTRAASWLHGAYGVMLGLDHNPLSFFNAVNGPANSEVQDPRYNNTKSVNTQLAPDGYIHMLPTVRYTVYAVKSGFLTTGGTLKQTLTT